MNEHNLLNEETLHIIREVENTPNLNQRLLSQKLNISLGKANYMLKELAKKGIIKIASFSSTPGKVNKLRYVLTQKGAQEKLTLTKHFLKAKEEEYYRLKNEYEKYLSEQSGEKIKRGNDAKQ